MKQVAEFFSRLKQVHLLFWNLSFKNFDVVPVFVAILVALGINDFVSTQGLKNTALYVVLQFIVSVCCFAFCFLWPAFRAQYQTISINMICLTLSIAFLSTLFALVIKFILIVPALESNVGFGIRRFIYDLEVFRWDIEKSFSLVLFFVAWVFILVNTIAVEGWNSFRTAILSSYIIPLVVSWIVAIVACLIVTVPIVLTMPI